MQKTAIVHFEKVHNIVCIEKELSDWRRRAPNYTCGIHIYRGVYLLWVRFCGGTIQPSYICARTRAHTRTPPRRSAVFLSLVFCPFTCISMYTRKRPTTTHNLYVRSRVSRTWKKFFLSTKFFTTHASALYAATTRHTQHRGTCSTH